MTIIVRRPPPIAIQQPPEQVQRVATQGIKASARPEDTAALDPTTFPHPSRGPKDAPILVLCDSPSIEAMRQGLPMTQEELRWFAKRASEQGFVENDFHFVSICSPIKQSDLTSAKRKWDHVSKFEPRVREIVRELNPRIVMTHGELATRMMMGRSIKITKQRGVARTGIDDRLVFPVLSPKLVRKQPDNIPIFDADLGTLSRLKQGDFDPTSLQVTDVDYQYCNDLSDWIANKPKSLAVDTETHGKAFRAPDFKVWCIQLSDAPGHTRIIPTYGYYLRWQAEFNARGFYMTQRGWFKVKAQIKELLEDASIPKLAHNFKFDDGALSYAEGINVKGWSYDTELMTRAVNENFMTYSLEDCTRIYVPEMAGYSDLFDQMVDKSRMIDVPPFDQFDEEGKIAKPGMLSYAGGDPDAVMRLGRALYPMLARDRGQMFLFKQVQMRGLLSFAKRIESYGQCIDRAALDTYEREVAEWVAEEEAKLFEMVPPAVRRTWLSNPDIIKDLAKRGNRSIPSIMFGKDKFIVDILFAAKWGGSDDGFKLKPSVWTPSTASLPENERVPSTSTKDHFPYFVNEPGKPGEFVTRYIAFKKAQTIHSKYIVNFYKYIKPANDNTGEEKIFPSYNFRTNTSRTNSQDPNGQNFPKRGDFAKGFLRLIKASASKILIAADMSQVELRLTAWSAMERNMLRIYNSGGDIHEATAAAVSRVDINTFQSWAKDSRLLIDVANEIPGSGAVLAGMNPGKRREFTVKDYYKLQRFRAKAVNFGFIYGAQARTFQIYAKTQYGVDYTLEEAQETRDLFFQTYKLEAWHERVETIVKRDGFVKTLHGGTRHLPSVWSTDYSVVSGAVRQAINAPIQRMGSDLGVIAIARLAAQCDPRLMRPVGFVHDQIICEVDPGYAQQCMGWLCWVMENPPLKEWFGIDAPLPFVADPEFGYNLAETAEVKRGENGIFINDKTKVELPNVRVEQPEWWNVSEDEAYDAFMRNEVPEWAGLVSRPDVLVRQRVRSF